METSTALNRYKAARKELVDAWDARTLAEQAAAVARKRHEAALDELQAAQTELGMAIDADLGISPKPLFGPGLGQVA